MKQERTGTKGPKDPRTQGPKEGRNSKLFL